MIIACSRLYGFQDKGGVMLEEFKRFAMRGNVVDIEGYHHRCRVWRLGDTHYPHCTSVPEAARCSQQLAIHSPDSGDVGADDSSISLLLNTTTMSRFPT